MTVTHGGNVFAVARERGWDWRQITDFSASINPLGPSPAVVEAVRGAVDRIMHYPEREPGELRRVLGELWGVDESCIFLGNGATELLHWFARVGGHERVTLGVPVFSEFYRAYPNAQCAPADDPSQWPRAGLFVVTQPNNPTGATIDRAALERTDNPVLVDESFLELAGLRSAAGLRPRLWVLRSLTKFYALPGLRVGALIGPREEVERLRPFREPWQVNVLAEAAALAAVGDREHGRRTLEFVRSEREWLSSKIAELPGAAPVPSCANYMLVQLDYSAADLAAHLLERKILIREWDPRAVRIAVRTRAENERLIAAWKEFWCER